MWYVFSFLHVLQVLCGPVDDLRRRLRRRHAVVAVLHAQEVVLAVVAEEVIQEGGKVRRRGDLRGRRSRRRGSRRGSRGRRHRRHWDLHDISLALNVNFFFFFFLVGLPSTRILASGKETIASNKR